jgi:predicted nucleotidyltransferase component of viral defense system
MKPPRSDAIRYSTAVDFERIRTLTITALFSDDELFDQIVLKGGNAISLVYGFSSRTSLDLDFSLENDFVDLERVRNRISNSLSARFASAGLVVFDEKFEPRPVNPKIDDDTTWGGYRLAFKLVEQEKYRRLGGDVESIRREALLVGPGQLRTFTVDFSKHEYCGGKNETELDDYTIYVYSPSMIAIEKLRAICQQIPHYRLRRNPRPRARDFYDIHELVSKAGVQFGTPENLATTARVFTAKSVPLRLIGQINQEREFHRPDWPAVEDTVAGSLRDFDYYFDFLLGQTEPLKALWIE